MMKKKVQFNLSISLTVQKNFNLRINVGRVALFVYAGGEMLEIGIIG